jgi:hypothetical protein
MTAVIWHKWGTFWRRKDGVVDLIYNSLTKYRKEGDFGPEAIENFKECAYLLAEHRRYPNELIRDEEVKLWWMYWVRRPFRKLWVKLGWNIKTLYRKQNDMTRDPYYAFGCVYAFLYRYNEDLATRLILTEHFMLVTVPFRLRRGGIQRWWNRLLWDRRKHYVIRLNNWKALGTHDWYEAVHANKFYKDTK